MCVSLIIYIYYSLGPQFLVLDHGLRTGVDILDTSILNTPLSPNSCTVCHPIKDKMKSVGCGGTESNDACEVYARKYRKPIESHQSSPTVRFRNVLYNCGTLIM